MYIEKIDRCENNPENSSTAKVSEHIPSGFLMSIISKISMIHTESKIVWKRFVDTEESTQWT